MLDIRLSDTEIAVMCDIARASGGDLTADKEVILQRLVADGLVDVSERGSLAATTPPVYALTRKAEQVLAERGVGVNES